MHRQPLRQDSPDRGLLDRGGSLSCGHVNLMKAPGETGGAFLRAPLYWGDMAVTEWLDVGRPFVFSVPCRDRGSHRRVR